jgi:serine/threonine protein phosphatase PrpC
VSERLPVEVGSLSDPGQVRELNEDYFGTPETMEISPELVEQQGRLYAVADGMGGHAAGEVASQQAVSALFEKYYASPSAEIIERMKEAIETANVEVHAQASLDRAKAGMGTTLVAAVLQGDDLYVANVGDSRAYLVREQSIEQVTRDHSWVNEQVQAGIITEQEAREHLYRNIITRSLGTKPEVDIDFFQRKVQPGDVLVLCCDGLSNEVEDDEIARIVSTNSAQKATQKLIDLANQRGGLDNVTAVVVRIGESVKAPRPVLPLAIGGGLAVLLIAAAVYFGRGPVGALLATPTTTPTATSTSTATLSPTYTSTATLTPTSTPTATPIPTFTPTATSKPTQTPTSTPTVTETPTEAPTGTPSPTLTTTPIETLTEGPSLTTTPVYTPTISPATTP